MRKYNESKVDFNVCCKFAFIHFIDDGANYSIDENEDCIYIDIKYPINEYEYSNFEKFYEFEKNKMYIIEDINTSIKRIRDEFDITTSILIDGGYMTIKIINSNDVIEGDFYRISKKNNSIHIFDEIINVLGLPKNVTMGISSNGTDNFIIFKFKDEDQLDENADKLIKKFSEIEINGILLNSKVEYGYSTKTGKIRKKYLLSKNKEQTYYRNGQRRTEIVNEISFGLTKKFNYL